MSAGNGKLSWAEQRAAELDASAAALARRLTPTRETDWERAARRDAARRRELEALRDLVVAADAGELLDELLDELLERAHDLLAAAAADGYDEARLPAGIPHDEEQ